MNKCIFFLDLTYYINDIFLDRLKCLNRHHIPIPDPAQYIMMSL